MRHESAMRGILSEHHLTTNSAANDMAEAIDGARERVELNSRGYRGRLGALARQPNDGPRLEEDTTARPSDKAAADWIALRRAKAGTLMPSALENKSAEIALRRGRALYDAASADVSALPPLYIRNHTKSARKKGDAVHSDDKAVFRMDFTIAGLNTDDEVKAEIPYQIDFRHRFGPPGAPRERRIASWSEEQAKVALSRMPTLQEERRDVPRGPDETRSPKVWQTDSLRWAGKVKGKGGPQRFNPATEDAPQHVRLDAVIELEVFKGLMSEAEYSDFLMILANNVPMGDVGVEAGFTGKQAEAVGLDRSRNAVASAICAFETIDHLTSEGGGVESLPGGTRLPAWLIQSARTRERCRAARHRARQGAKADKRAETMVNAKTDMAG